VAILGNHDDERAVAAALERRGIDVLADARTALAARGTTLELIGLKFWTRRADTLAGLMKGASGPAVLLAHDPRRVIEASALGIPCVLSGHTHGGQVVLPGLGAPAARQFPVARGRFTRGGTELYVSAGVGTVVVPLRINCPPEVSIVTLRSRG
jgi:predicted MPP superfamily phosphohydrolase